MHVLCDPTMPPLSFSWRNKSKRRQTNVTRVHWGTALIAKAWKQHKSPPTWELLENAGTEQHDERLSHLQKEGGRSGKSPNSCERSKLQNGRQGPSRGGGVCLGAQKEAWGNGLRTKPWGLQRWGWSGEELSFLLLVNLCSASPARLGNSEVQTKPRHTQN